MTTLAEQLERLAKLRIDEVNGLRARGWSRMDAETEAEDRYERRVAALRAGEAEG